MKFDIVLNQVIILFIIMITGILPQKPELYLTGLQKNFPNFLYMLQIP